jgi:outer membrane protein assembly factor BamB
LTARDPQTGKQLWQRQYPIAGARIDPARGTDGTEGFRLVTITDQLLYAVVWYRYNGQDIFARYGLSPRDGSILWQDRELISGRMPEVDAQIVDGVIYTTEYNLKPVSPSYIDSHGMTIGEVVQSRAAAYDATTGKRLWQTPEMVGEEPNGGFYQAVSGGLLYFQTYNNQWPATAQHPNSITTLHVLSTIDGSPRWQYQAKDGGMTGAVVEGENVYFETSLVKTVGNKQDLQVKIVALDARAGDTRWSTPVQLLDGTEKTPTPSGTDPGSSGGFAVDMAPVASKDAVYYSTPGSRVYALQPSDGKILAQFWVDKTPQTTVIDRVVLFVVP